MECPKCGRQVSPGSQRCGSCGKAIPPGQHLLAEAGLLEADETPTRVSAAQPAVASRVSYRTASLGDRMIATLLDGVVLLGGATLIAAWCFMRWGYAADDGVHVTTASLLIAGLLTLALTFLYYWLPEAGWGATLGKIIVGIRVFTVGVHGKLAAAAIRNALRVVDGIGFYLLGTIVAGCSRRGQRLGDLVGGTVVAEDRFSAWTKVLTVVLWTGAMAGAAWGLPRVCAADATSHPPRYLARTVGQIAFTGDSFYVSVSRLHVSVHVDSSKLTTDAALK